MQHSLAILNHAKTIRPYLETTGVYSESTGVFSETIALAQLRPKSMACHDLRIPAQRTFFHACLHRQNAPQPNPLATQRLNIANSRIFPAVEIEGVEKTEKNPEERQRGGKGKGDRLLFENEERKPY